MISPYVSSASRGASTTYARVGAVEARRRVAGSAETSALRIRLAGSLADDTDSHGGNSEDGGDLHFDGGCRGVV